MSTYHFTDESGEVRLIGEIAAVGGAPGDVPTQQAGGRLAQAPSGGGLPISWVDDGHGAVIAKTDGEDATALEVAGLAGQTADVFRVVAEDATAYHLLIYNKTFDPAVAGLSMYVGDAGDANIACDDTNGSATFGTSAGYRLSWNGTGLCFFQDATHSVAQQVLARPGGDAGALWDVLNAYGLVVAP